MTALAVIRRGPADTCLPATGMAVETETSLAAAGLAVGCSLSLDRSRALDTTAGDGALPVPPCALAPREGPACCPESADDDAPCFAELPVSADALPAPQTSAAPTPSVNAPNPNKM